MARRANTFALGAVLAGVSVVLFWPVIVQALAEWASSQDLNFGFATPLVTGAILWLRRSEIRRSLGNGTRIGIGVVVLGILLYALCLRLQARSPAAISTGVVIFGSVLYLWGWKAARVLAFPIGFFTFGLALQQTLVSPLAFVLQSITADGVGMVSWSLRLPIVQQGLVLRGPDFSFVVADVCSGMSSLLALVGLGALWAYVARQGRASSLAMVASLVPLVIFANTARVVSVLLVALWLGQDAALGFFHGFSSLILFGIALAGMVLVTRLTQWLPFTAD